MKEIYLAGGCFWGVEGYFQKIEGIISTEVGYCNGDIENPSYEQVCTGKTNFAECVKVLYDEKKIKTEDLIQHLFRIIDPTSINRQGNDIGSQYRTGIYSDNIDLVDLANDLVNIKQLDYNDKIQLETEILDNYYPAEDYHQDYLIKNPSGYCHIDLSLADKPI